LTGHLESIQAGTPSGKFLNLRTARRLMQIAKTWWGEDGTPGSAVLSLLPTDPQKLSWISKLTSEQLQTFVTDHDCKGESRNVIIGAVKDVIGKGKPKASVSSPLTKALRTVTRGLERVVKVAQEPSRGAVDPDEVRKVKAEFDRAYAYLSASKEAEEEDDDSESEIPIRPSRTPARNRARSAPPPAVAAAPEAQA
jgi:hypothetical protein